ncbi:efflux RND transporter periplasmic adaptor subunit [Rhodanobacter sp. B2A1Ga4]|uniref:efflux RND transporter periplasmic adaptor subunit n=1 Tax=Rhodanobacter sp. B2A1Ga4 TaxID=2778647 RepID=UPI001B359A07|nr:efflux RND transporter periplasmic adaptor subunit [Rhodanobacter sp. B2A1Ga4]MBQ4856271.1 efflux RND transporter periplasmic adaptor subunit [Rhodanobacter sp. B2A1Ga4]
MKSVLRHVAMSLVVVALAGCGNRNPPAATKVASPALAGLVVHAQAARDEQVWDGVVEAVNQATITAQTNARVIELPHDVNDVVARGDVLVRFTDVEQKSARSAAQAQVAAAEATYREAAATYERIKAVYAKGFVSATQMDQQRAQRDAAQAALASARAQSEQVGQALDYTVLRAPYAGIITRRYVQVGEAVQAGPPSPQPLIALQSLDELRVSVQVPQSAVDAIRRFHAADVLPGDDGARRVAASSVKVFPYADPDTHTFTVRLQLPAGDSGLYPGMTVKVAFATGEVKRLLLPASALVQRGELVGVYVLDEHGVALRQLRIGHRIADKVEVLAGLDDGERIATDPAAAARWLTADHRAGAAP